MSSVRYVLGAVCLWHRAAGGITAWRHRCARLALSVLVLAMAVQEAAGWGTHSQPSSPTEEHASSEDLVEALRRRAWGDNQPPPRGLITFDMPDDLGKRAVGETFTVPVLIVNFGESEPSPNDPEGRQIGGRDSRYVTVIVGQPETDEGMLSADGPVTPQRVPQTPPKGTRFSELLRLERSFTCIAEGPVRIQPNITVFYEWELHLEGVAGQLLPALSEPAKLWTTTMMGPSTHLRCVGQPVTRFSLETTCGGSVTVRGHLARITERIARLEYFVPAGGQVEETLNHHTGEFLGTLELWPGFYTGQLIAVTSSGDRIPVHYGSFTIHPCPRRDDTSRHTPPPGAGVTDRGAGPQATPTPPMTDQPPVTGQPPVPPEPPPQTLDTTSAPPQSPPTGDVSHAASAICCERCPGTDWDRFYFPVPPDTDCQPGDVRRDELSVSAGTCVNPLTEEPGPPTYGDACCAKRTAQVLYDSTRSGEVTSDVGSALRAACGEDPCAGKGRATSDGGAPTRLDTSILSTGTDVHGRNWVPERATLKVGKDRLRPCHTEPFYVTKESSTNAAVVVLSAISADYADDAPAAEAAKGTSCHASEEGPRGRKDTPQERAAKAAAIGLLASQAKGQVEGLRATFDVTGKEAQLRDAKLQATVVNQITQEKSSLSLPLRFNASERSEETP